MVEKNSFKIYIIFSFTLYLVVIDLIFFEICRLLQSKIVSTFQFLPCTLSILPKKAPPPCKSTLDKALSKRFFTNWEFRINCWDLWNFSPYQELKMHIRKVIPDGWVVKKMGLRFAFFSNNKYTLPGIVWLTTMWFKILYKHTNTHKHTHETFSRPVFYLGFSTCSKSCRPAHFVAKKSIDITLKHTSAKRIS